MRIVYKKTFRQVRVIKEVFKLSGVRFNDFVNASPYSMKKLVQGSRQEDYVSWRSAGLIIAYIVEMNNTKAASYFEMNHSSVNHALKKLSIEMESPKFGQDISDCLRSVSWYMVNRRESDKPEGNCNVTPIELIAPLRVG